MMLPNHTHQHQIDGNVSYSQGLGSHTHSMDARQQILHADLALMVVNGELNVIKNRYGLHGTHIPVHEAIPMFSGILTDMIFRGNDLEMFKEGLKQQIESAISKAIFEFHESR